MPLRVLNIEDNPADADLLLETLELEGKADRLDVVWEKRLQSGLRRLDTDLFDAVLLDLNLPDGSGVEVISRVRSVAPEIPLLVMTGIDDEELALQAVQAGAQDYLLKGQINAALLERSIRYAIERKRSEIALQRRAREMEALYQTSLEINA
ncbi:MAG: response regulator, partial [Anaerolineae bacterium]|nr:response regulator [Anaerolineae bacterium]